MGLKNVRYGQQMVEEVGALLPDSFAVATMAEPWAVVALRLGRTPHYTLEVADMGEDAVAQAERAVPPVKAILGVGGGASMDMAKYIHWKRDIPLYLMPTIASVDAGVTSTVAVRVDGKVRYVGQSEPELVAVDYPVVRGAPARLNRAGVGDILSIHTALWDWKCASERRQEPYDAAIAGRVGEMVQQMASMATDLRDVTDAGVKLLFDLYNGENDICEGWGNSRPEEGSEHFFAYNVEYLTGKHFVHGELVCLGVYVLSYLQGNRADWVHEFINQVGVRYRLSDLNITQEEFRQALLTLNRYVRQENLFYSVIDETIIDEQVAAKICADLDIL
ncbi:MAG TPA: iron-containing alcohol dehydrogenase [Anaerolineae bacterium]|nr:iron-containing alcohol dehydrogenase [Anaerolineae bacterium]HOQ98139.1 iron-containing alcohol dehydrogenase [Anaerolineae bacterium]HPL30114.1 iron-containing alcohol dehydrogenase [Anaerolineae bacterium]